MPELNRLPPSEAAFCYAQRGWPVFPLFGKVPFKETRGYKEATTNREQIQDWWSKHPFANIGLPTGAVSGLLVLDIDPRHGGNESVHELEKRYSRLPATRLSRTAHSGLHRFYLHPRDDQTYPNAIELDQLAGLDVRGDGGYVVLPPSRLPPKLAYRWVRFDFPIAPAPDWLLALLARSKESLPAPLLPTDAFFTVGEKWLDQALAKVGIGNRNRAGFDLACQLRDDGVPEQKAARILRAYAEQVPQGDEPYTVQEALNSLRSAYRHPRRPKAQRRD